ncbi:hypothetical protein B5808_16985 [Cnuibacter physcomitrellae]|uniref:Toxin n=1 Tax=Cnuibacter physcomitrellae TaxID=1619308 RepID=A0A1X9LU32_9MICO|nr:hypothetical protein [Cnuibacter physcomitrellae]ARJ06729.1 hypothetical protein B5808_16985 [Cnuibacter physcomitrellae]
MGRTYWVQSAAKHGVAREDVMHVVDRPELVIRDFDPPRPPSTGRVDLYVGHTADGTLLEVLLDVDAVAERVTVFHAMPLRRSIAERAIRMARERQ